MQQSGIYTYMRCAFFALCIMKSKGSGLGLTVQIYGMLIFRFLCCFLHYKPRSDLFIYLECYVINVLLFLKGTSWEFLLLHEWFVTRSLCFFSNYYTFNWLTRDNIYIRVFFYVQSILSSHPACFKLLFYHNTQLDCFIPFSTFSCHAAKTLHVNWYIYI